MKFYSSNDWDKSKKKYLKFRSSESKERTYFKYRIYLDLNNHFNEQTNKSITFFRVFNFTKKKFSKFKSLSRRCDGSISGYILLVMNTTS